MNCLDARRALGAEPARRTAELSAHLAACTECTRHAAELAALDARILVALAVPVPAPAAAGARRVDRAGRRWQPRWTALAASAAAAALLAAALAGLYPRETLAGAIVGHLAHEPDAWARTDVPVAAGALGEVLRRSGVALRPGLPQVSYAMSCAFRGWQVPHLVVQSTSGPVTVLVLTHERVTAPTPIDEGGYRGVLVPAARGGFAVLTRGDVGADELAEVVARVSAAVRFID